MEIKPSSGIGDVTLSSSPSEVKAVFGEKLWEEWMDGNLNDTLYYKNIIIFFDKCDAYGPLTNAKIAEIQIYKGFNALLFGQNPFEMTALEIQSLLAKNGFESKWYKELHAA